MSDLNSVFLDYFEKFKELDTCDKRRELVNSINEIINLVNFLSMQDNISLDYLKCEDDVEFRKEFKTEDEYLNMLLFYIENVKVLLGQYLDKKI